MNIENINTDSITSLFKKPDKNFDNLNIGLLNVCCEELSSNPLE